MVGAKSAAFWLARAWRAWKPERASGAKRLSRADMSAYATLSTLIRCTVPTRKRAAILCMPPSPFDSAARMAFSVAGPIRRVEPHCEIDMSLARHTPRRRPCGTAAVSARTARST
jgi:hypothetical protein